MRPRTAPQLGSRHHAAGAPSTYLTGPRSRGGLAAGASITAARRHGAQLWQPSAGRVRGSRPLRSMAGPSAAPELPCDAGLPPGPTRVSRAVPIVAPGAPSLAAPAGWGSVASASAGPAPCVAGGDTPAAGAHAWQVSRGSTPPRAAVSFANAARRGSAQAFATRPPAAPESGAPPAARFSAPPPPHAPGADPDDPAAGEDMMKELCVALDARAARRRQTKVFQNFRLARANTRALLWRHAQLTSSPLFAPPPDRHAATTCATLRRSTPRRRRRRYARAPHAARPCLTDPEVELWCPHSC